MPGRASRARLRTAAVLAALPLLLTACSAGAHGSGAGSVRDAARTGGTPSGDTDPTTTTKRPATTEAPDPASAPVNVIEVVGSQWQWAFTYKEGPGRQIGAVHDAAASGDVPTLYLPQGQPVRLEMKSTDVIHSLYIPAFLVKLDLVPGRTNKFEFTPNVVGDYDGHCAELCGAGHHEMRVVTKVVTPEEYRRHLTQLKAQARTEAAA
ncbi:cytochrome c oxidase subunit II [Streptodolium elevatio]|uniref:Cytochrome aa3 subunit 2 n=1 Tax=Streptodolium elevatio TaxID=3157996 RepID=A0ABV3DWI4_9ACTN